MRFIHLKKHYYTYFGKNNWFHSNHFPINSKFCINANEPKLEKMNDDM